MKANGKQSQAKQREAQGSKELGCFGQEFALPLRLPEADHV